MMLPSIVVFGILGASLALGSGAELVVPLHEPKMYFAIPLTTAAPTTTTTTTAATTAAPAPTTAACPSGLAFCPLYQYWISGSQCVNQPSVGLSFNSIGTLLTSMRGSSVGLTSAQTGQMGVFFTNLGAALGISAQG